MRLEDELKLSIDNLLPIIVNPFNRLCAAVRGGHFNVESLGIVNAAGLNIITTRAND